MEVMATLTAETAPIMVPNHTPPRTHTNGMASILNRVAMIAMSIPIAERKFPCRAVFTFPSRLIPKIKRMAETM